MAKISDIMLVLDEFNQKYPRPNMGELEIKGPYDIGREFSNPYPNGHLPGVYVIIDRKGLVLRIGKASCNSTITSRLGSYFKWGDSDSEGVHKFSGYEEARIIYSIGIPKDRAFEAPAVEEFLVERMKPPYNRNGRNGL